MVKGCKRTEDSETKHTVMDYKARGETGGVHFRTTKSGLTITMANNMPYMPENMASRVLKAIERREHGMKEAMKAIIERNAKQAERKQGR